jgi:hypothetical protein
VPRDRDAATGDSGGDASTGLAALATDAFVWGYPLVVTQRTLQTFAPIGMNNLFNQTALSTPAIRLVVAPNVDTLYSVSVVDVRSEPIVLVVPDVTDRYWTYQFLDGWMDSFHYVGTRATNGKGGSFAITPPGYTGTLPAGVTEVRSPTPVLFLLGRYLVRDSADIANVTALDRRLVPLHELTGAPAPAPPEPLGTPPGKAQDVGTTGAAFFDELGDALAVNGPATDADRAALARFAALGIGPGLHPASAADAGSAALDALSSGVTEGLSRLSSAFDANNVAGNGWSVRLDIGTYTDPLLRAAVARFAWGANVPQEAVYALSRADGTGAPYDGSRPYVLHFDASALPPVDPTLGFWSLTLYGTDMFFVENSISRYAIGDRTPGLAFGADGSLDLFIQNAAPPGHEGNWLPSPASAFVLLLRLYLPEKAVLDGRYVYPPVVVAAP